MKHGPHPVKLCIPEKVLDQHMVVLGKTGAGKSSALRHVVEHLLADNKRVCIVDPKGDWWGLKSSADGKAAGFPVIAFGDFKNASATDVPINEQSGKHVAELVATGNRPCIIGLRGWTQGAMTRFWIDFASTLFARNAGELFLVGDEFHNFAPKGKVLSPQAGEALHWSNRLLSEGRGLGLVCLIASQRPQKVHNDTLTSCETLVAMRVIHAADREAVKAWIDGNGDAALGKEVLNTLASLNRGEAWVWSPEIGFGPARVKFPMFTTFDSFAPPQLQKKVYQSGWADVNLDEVKAKLASVIEEHKAKDPRELQKRIAEQAREISRLKSEKPAAAPKIIEKPVVSEKLVRDVERIVSRLEKDADRRIAFAGKLTEAADALRTSGEQLKSTGQTFAAALRGANAPQPVRAPQRQPVQQHPMPQRKTVAESEAAGELTGPEQRILDALAWLEIIGVQEPEQPAVAFLAGYTYGSGGYNNPRGALRAKALIEYRPDDHLMLTEAGRAVANYPQDMKNVTTAELHKKVLAKLPGPEQKILEALLKAYPDAIPNEELARAAGYTPGSGGYNNPRGRLRTLGLVEYRDGCVAARPILFLDEVTA